MHDDADDRTSPFLPHFLARAGVAARRKCAAIVRAGRVTVNGVMVDRPATRVDPVTDVVVCDGRVVRPQDKHYLMLHKPVGYVCSSKDCRARHLAIELVADAAPARLFSVGRLDKDSEGLLLFTNDGALSQHLTHPRYGVRKTYEVTATGACVAADLARLTTGITDAGECLRAVSAALLSHERDGSRLRIVVAEGRNREVRRMCAALGLTVRRLVRTAFGPLQLGDLRPGQWRRLSPSEVGALREAGSTDAA